VTRGFHPEQALTWHDYEVQLLIGVDGWGQRRQEATRVRWTETDRLAVVGRLSPAGVHRYPRALRGRNRDQAGRAPGACPSSTETGPRCPALGRKGPFLERRTIELVCCCEEKRCEPAARMAATNGPVSSSPLGMLR